MRRDDLTDAEWERVAPLLSTYGDHGDRSPDDRMVINALLYQARTGVRWRSLPDRYGCWVTAYKRHRRWTADGTWQRLTLALRTSGGDPTSRATTPPAYASPRTHQPAPGSPHTAPPPLSHLRDAAVLASLQALLGDVVQPRRQ
ncbi:transposase [Nonomuraea sp. MTCD27]|uniref:transposase n=1 Tax=Nonomuraea sp. MTCD27 TaxID=1676747 RepID=UPI0035C1FB1F